MQLCTSNSIKFFDAKMRSKYPFDYYVSSVEPTLFFGAYSRGDVKKIVDHKGGKIALINGSDSMRKENMVAIANSGANIIAGSKWVINDLESYGIKNYTYIPFVFGNIYDWRPEPLGDSLYWYGGNQTKYGKLYQGEIRRAFPDLNIIIMDNNTVPHSAMADIYKKCFAGIRLVDHDGMSQTVAEMALMGRMSIWNGGGPFSVCYKNINNIINIIKTLREKNISPRLVSKRARGFFIDGEKQWCKLVLSLFWTKEIDVAGIFENSNGRCGSIFRIQRRSDIEKIGGLGDSQYERPWFHEQMKNLGKKELITSKNSGFIVTEFKGMDGKGYPSYIKPHTYDEKYSRHNCFDL